MRLALAVVRITEGHACHRQLLSCTSAHSGLDVECLLKGLYVQCLVPSYGSSPREVQDPEGSDLEHISTEQSML